RGSTAWRSSGTPGRTSERSLDRDRLAGDGEPVDFARGGEAHLALIPCALPATLARGHGCDVCWVAAPLVDRAVEVDGHRVDDLRDRRDERGLAALHL